MQVSVEKVSNIERRMTIVVPASQVDDAYKKEISRIQKTAKIDGYRPGKVPSSVISQRFGDVALREVTGKVMQEALFAALEQEKMHPISLPQVQPKLLSKGEPLEFTASFEVLPNIDNVLLNLDTVEKINVAVSIDDVKNVIQQLCKQYATWTNITRPAEKNDRVVIDYYAIFEGKADAENKVQSFPLELGSGLMLPGFEDGLLGAKPGEERTLKLSFPANFTVADKAGKPVDFVVQVKEIFEATIPTLDEKFIQQLGVKSGKQEELEEQVQQSLERECERHSKDTLKEVIFSKLIEQNSIDLPQSLVKQEVKRIHDEVYKNQNHDHHNHSIEEMNKFEAIAKKRITVGLLIREYINQQNMQVNNDLVNKRIEEIAASYEHPQEVIAWLSTEDRKRDIEAQVLEEQVLEKLLAGATIVEKNMSYAELKGLRI